jgi:hypothetical protein
MKRLLGLAVAAALAVATLVTSPVAAQPAGAIQAQTPMTRNTGTVRTLTGAVAGTYDSADIDGYNVSRVTCVLNIASKVGTPVAQFQIDGKDASSGLYYTLLQSATPLSTTATANAIHVGAGLPATANVSAGLPIPKAWRVRVVITGTTSMTGTVGCSIQ